MNFQYKKRLALSKRSASNGFTLMELLVVSVILALLSIVIAQVFFTTLRTNSKNESVRNVKGNGEQALEIMTRLIQNATRIDPPTSVTCLERPEVSGGFTELTLTHIDGGETKLKCIDTATISRIASVSAAQTVYLTGSGVTLFDSIDGTSTCTHNLDAFIFNCSSVGSTPAYITIKFKLRQMNSFASVVETASQTFQTTVTLRNR